MDVGRERLVRKCRAGLLQWSRAQPAVANHPERLSQAICICTGRRAEPKRFSRTAARRGAAWWTVTGAAAGPN